jgi:hypothetical protein
VVQVGVAGSVPTHLNGVNSGAKGEIEKLELLLLEDSELLLLTELTLLLDEEVMLDSLLLTLDSLLLTLDELLTVLSLDELLTVLSLDELLTVLSLDELLTVLLLDELLVVLVEEVELVLLEAGVKVSVTSRIVPVLVPFLGPTATVTVPLTPGVRTPWPVLEKLTVVFAILLVSVTTTFVFGLKVMGSNAQLALSVVLATVDGVATVSEASVWATLSPVRLNVTAGGVAPRPIDTLHT